MPSTAPEPKPAHSQAAAAQNIQEAHTLLRSLQESFDEQQLEEAIEKLESALRILAVKTGGML